MSREERKELLVQLNAEQAAILERIEANTPKGYISPPPPKNLTPQQLQVRKFLEDRKKASFEYFEKHPYPEPYLDPAEGKK